MFEKFQDFKEYASTRSQIRFTGMGVINARLTKISSGTLKRFIKQLDNDVIKSQPKIGDLVKKELEFRQVCLNLKSVFDIKVR